MIRFSERIDKESFIAKCNEPFMDNQTLAYLYKVSEATIAETRRKLNCANKKGRPRNGIQDDIIITEMPKRRHKDDDIC